MSAPSLLRAALDNQQTEAQFQAEIVQLAKLRGWKCMHQFDSRRSDFGWPDLAMVRGPEMVVAECKTEKGRVTVAQQAWLDALGAVPGVGAFVWRPSDWLFIEAVLM